MGSLEFRANFLLWSVINVFWAFFSVLFINLIFSQVTSIAGWSRDNALILAGIQAAFVAALWVFILPGVTEFSGVINGGYFDFLLLKPINTRFLISFRKLEFDNLPRFLVSVAMVIYLSQNSIGTITIPSTLYSIILFLMGLFIFYNFFFIIGTTNFWFIKIFNLENLFDSIMETGKFPSGIFTGLSKLVLIYLIPTVFIATFPTQALLGTRGVDLVGVGIIFSCVLFFISHKFWHFALRHYSSASS